MQLPFTCLALLVGAVADAGGLDGHYALVSYADAEGEHAAAELSPAGCWSREIWAFRDDQLTRGHQRRCQTGRYVDTCEAWVSTQVQFDRGLVVPQDATASSSTRTLRVIDEIVDGEAIRTIARRSATCSAGLETARYEITMEEHGDQQLIVLTDQRRSRVWRLAPAPASDAPFTEVAR